MNAISRLVEEKVRQTFPPQAIPAALEALRLMQQPPAEGDWARTRERVQIALLMTAGAHLENLLEGIAGSQADWRDTLVAAGLAEDDWPGIARAHGYTVT